MRPIVATVGPLVAGAATKVAAAQRSYGTTAALALNGTASNNVAGTVAATQSPAAAALTINGTYAKGGVAYLGGPKYVYITSGGDDHSITFRVVGTSGLQNIVVSETLQGSNASVVGSKTLFNTIISVTPSGAVATTANVGTFTGVTLDVPRRILFTTSADESANTATIYGTDGSNTAISETLTLVNNTTVSSVLDYKTVNKITIAAAAAGTISAGTTDVAASAWVRLDTWAGASASVQCTVSGTVNYTVQTSNDDPNYPYGAVTPAGMTWLSSLDTAVVAATASKSSFFQYVPVFARVLLNSGTGSVTMTVAQTGVAPY